MFDLFSDAVLAGLNDARVGAKEVKVGHVGNFVAALFTGQGMLGGWFGHMHPDFSGMPAAWQGRRPSRRRHWRRNVD